MANGWKSLKGREIQLADGRIVYEKKDVIDIANRLLGDIGYLEYHSLKTLRLSEYNKERITEAIFERFPFQCDLCYNKSYDLTKMKSTYNYRGKKIKIDYYVCWKCKSKMIDKMEEKLGCDRELAKQGDKEQIEILNKVIMSFWDENHNHKIPDELGIGIGHFRFNK